MTDLPELIEARKHLLKAKKEIETALRVLNFNIGMKKDVDQPKKL